MIRWPGDAPLPSRVVKAAARGDTVAVAQILHNFRPLIRRVVQRVPVEYREDAEDEICLSLLASLSAFEPLPMKDEGDAIRWSLPLIQHANKSSRINKHLHL